MHPYLRALQVAQPVVALHVILLYFHLCIVRTAWAKIFHTRCLPQLDYFWKVFLRRWLSH